MQPSTGLMKRPRYSMYVQNIIVPFVEQTRESLGEDEDKAVTVLMDNLKGQVTPAMTGKTPHSFMFDTTQHT